MPNQIQFEELAANQAAEGFGTLKAGERARKPDALAAK